MSNPDYNLNEFEDWLSSGLKEPQLAGNDLVDQLLCRVQDQKAVQQLLRQKIYANMICGGIVAAVLCLGLGILFYSSMASEIVILLSSSLGGMAQMIMQPTLESLAIPLAGLLLAGVFLWNLCEMLSLE